MNVCTLDDGTITRLTEEFNAVDVSQTGTLLPEEIKILIQQSYAPTEEELSNVFQCLNVNTDDIVVFEEFVFGFYRLYQAIGATEVRTPEALQTFWAAFAAELHHMAKQGKHQHAAEIQFTSEVSAKAFEDLGPDWVADLRQRFANFSPTGSGENLARDDMRQLLKEAFTPSDDKIEKVMMFFSMSGEEGITLPNFLNGMTLLYGDLGHLAASPKQKTTPISPISPPTGEYGQGQASPFSLAVEPVEEPPASELV